MNYIKSSNIRGKDITFPVFFPDATRGVIRSIDSKDLVDVGTEGLIINTYHLLSQPGPSVIKSMGGASKFMSWPGFLISDSGGFQIFSMIHRNKSLGTIGKDGATFHLTSKGGRRKYKVTPEKCIQMQFDLNTDVMICLDYFTPHNADLDEIKKSVTYTTKWAKRCKDEFEKQCEARGLEPFDRTKAKKSDKPRPLLFGVVQGAHDKTERIRSATELEEIGFDGYGLGGWPFDNDGNMDLDIIEHIANITPDTKLRYALGIGNPQGTVDCVKLGYQIFDCVLPTRDARHKRLYCFSKNPIVNIFEEPRDLWYEYVYINREKYVRDESPISEFCDCYTCKNYSKGYLHHLFEIEDSLAFRLATIHNLRFYNKVIELCRKQLA